MNSRKLDLLDEILAPDCVRHCQATPNVTVKSLADFKEYLRQDFAVFPDSVQSLTHLVAEGDLVVSAVLFVCGFVFWTYYPHGLPLPTTISMQKTAGTPPAATPAPPAAPQRPRNPVTDITPPKNPVTDVTPQR